MVQASAQSARLPGPGQRSAGASAPAASASALSALSARSSSSTTFSGSHAAVALCADAATDPSGPLLGVIVGRGGTGKSALLDVLADIYTAAGVPVHRDASSWPPAAV